MRVAEQMLSLEALALLLIFCEHRRRELLGEAVRPLKMRVALEQLKPNAVEETPLTAGNLLEEVKVARGSTTYRGLRITQEGIDTISRQRSQVLKTAGRRIKSASPPEWATQLQELRKLVLDLLAAQDGRGPGEPAPEAVGAPNEPKRRGPGRPRKRPAPDA